MELYKVYCIRLQRSKKVTDCERFWYYKTKQDAEEVAKKLHGYKITIETCYAGLPYEELIQGKWEFSRNMRYPKL